MNDIVYSSVIVDYHHHSPSHSKFPPGPGPVIKTSKYTLLLRMESPYSVYTTLILIMILIFIHHSFKLIIYSVQ